MTRDAFRLPVLTAVAAARLTPVVARPWLYRLAGVRVGASTRILHGLTVCAGPVSIGQRVFLNQDVVLDPGVAGIDIADDVSIGARVVLAAAGHRFGPSTRRALGCDSAPIRIGRGCWIGAGAVVLPGVTVAPGCIVGAGAVVTRDTRPDGTYAGVPARRLRDLPDHEPEGGTAGAQPPRTSPRRPDRRD